MRSILFFIESLDGGGAEGALENIVTNLDKEKYDITVISETDNESRTERVKKHCRYRAFAPKNLSGSFFHEFANKIIYKFSWSAPPSLVKRVLLRGKYDIEVACCEGYATKLIGNSKNSKSKKIAWVHTDFINNPWSKSVYAGGEVEERSCYENFDKIICVSETMRDSFIKTYGFEDKIQVIHNIVDDEKIKKRGLEKIEERVRPQFVLAGSFLKVKGFERAVKIFGRLRDEGYRFSVKIMGRGYERESVEKLVNELNLQNEIELMEYQSNPYKHMAAADAFICSSYAEGYSTTVTESIILGVPIITTDCSGMREIFGPNKCGIICKNNDEALYTAIKKVLDEPDLLKEYQKEAQLRSSYFSKDSLVKEVESFFDSI